jgi:hypothetical protein
MENIYFEFFTQEIDTEVYNQDSRQEESDEDFQIIGLTE